MIFAVARRKKDGLLSWAQVCPEPPDQTVIRQNAVNALGGTLEDWEYVELSQQQHDLLMAAMPGRSYLSGGALFSRPKPTLDSDKLEIQDDGADTATLTFDVQDPGFNGVVNWKVIAPDGSFIAHNKFAAAGVSTLTLTTTQTGSIRVEANVITHGVGNIIITGV